MPIHAPQITQFVTTQSALAAALSGILHDGDVVYATGEQAVGVVRDNIVYALTETAGRCFHLAVGPAWSDYADSIEVADQLVQRDGLVFRPNIERIAESLR
jgi:hypothetical protein